LGDVPATAFEIFIQMCTVLDLDKGALQVRRKTAFISFVAGDGRDKSGGEWTEWLEIAIASRNSRLGEYRCLTSIKTGNFLVSIRT